MRPTDAGAEIGPATRLSDAQARLAARLQSAGIEAPLREAALLLQRAARLSAANLIAAPDAPLGEAAARVEAFARRRAAREPLSRIEGRRAFWRHEFTITPDVLDPRADTETIVEAALEALAPRRAEALRVLDFGVGSGALLCALLGEWPRATGLGVDLSQPAAAVARANVAALGLARRADIRVGRWDDGLAGSFDVIVSNPPYISTQDIAGLEVEVRRYDPGLALDGGGDGLDAYRALAPAISRRLAPDGWFFLEIGEGQGEAVTKLLLSADLEILEKRRDLSGIERAISGRLRSTCVGSGGDGN